MTWHVVGRFGREEENFEPALREGGERVEVPIDVPGAPSSMRHNVWSELDRHRLDVPPLAVDLFRVAAVVLAADLRIPRKSAFDDWTRDITLYLPVSDLDAWERVQDRFRDLIAFLTGDHWTVHFRQANVPRPPLDEKLRGRAIPLEAEAACLLSGGLDSFIGATDALSAGRSLALVSHYAAGGAGTHASPAQDLLRNELAERYGADHVRHLKFQVTPPKSLTGETEDTTRSRSIIFLALGALVASGIRGGVPLLVPENGLISLNVPLTPNRLGSHSTRTTHPHTMQLFGEILAGLGLRVPIELPYRFSTKGEMLINALDQELIRRGAGQTVSCARPGQARWTGGSEYAHCGYCVPCLIRRASMARAGLDDRRYRLDVLDMPAHATATQLENLRLFRVAGVRAAERSGWADVLKSGPLPDDATVFDEYVGVYRRGLEEVVGFLDQRPLRIS